MLEALSRRRPVLASRDTHSELLPEWLRIIYCVTFVENPMDVAALAQGLERLLQSDPARAEAAAEVMGRYRWDRLIGEYLDQIEAALLAAK
jgi:glycosyltransferase involved in cell wall biosynthesis